MSTRLEIQENLGNLKRQEKSGNFYNAGSPTCPDKSVKSLITVQYSSGSTLIVNVILLCNYLQGGPTMLLSGSCVMQPICYVRAFNDWTF